MEEVNKPFIIFSILLFVTAIVLGLVFGNFLSAQKTSITTKSIMEEKNVIEQENKELYEQLENLSEKECFTEEEKQRLKYMIDEMSKKIYELLDENARLREECNGMNTFIPHHGGGGGY